MDSEFDNAYLGFDPGKEGAMAVIGPHLIPSAHAFDKRVYVEKLVDLKKQFNLFAVVEHVGAMPGQGVTSCFSFGESFGWLQGVLDAMQIPYELAREVIDSRTLHQNLLTLHRSGGYNLGYDERLHRWSIPYVLRRQR